MKIISWNINGIRAVYKKGFLDWLEKSGADIVCLQEIKAKVGQVPAELVEPTGYFSYFNPAERPGYAGTAVFCKQKPIEIVDKIGFNRFDQEGRVQILKYPNFTLFNLYVPNAGKKKERLDYKLESFERIFKFLKKVKVRPTQNLGRSDLHFLLAGDFNVAHKEIDLARPKQNKNNAGFTIGEREKIDKLLKCGFVDTFRMFNKESGNYTWWSNFSNARARNLGWRVDYCFASTGLKPSIDNAFILPKVIGSDHCPVGVEINN